jgi:hypothetical protein
MKTHLMYRDRDFDMEEKLPPCEEALKQDLELEVLYSAMASGDEFLFNVAGRAVPLGLHGDLETIHYRQAVLQDCLQNYSVVKSIYDIAVSAIEGKRGLWWGIPSHYPSGILYGALELLQMLMVMLGQLKQVADEHAHEFRSEGFVAFFDVIKAELADEYLAGLKIYLKELEFRKGVLISARLGRGNEGTDYVLRKSPRPGPGWIERIFDRTPAFSFRIAERDEAGARALSELRDRGINLVANALAQSADHVQSFFVMLRTELAFYLGCVNLRQHLDKRDVPVCFPVPEPAGMRRHSCVGLRDTCLALTADQSVVGNDIEADGKNLVIITGANQGGKSTFLRSIGLAQLMMQCGMFVTAESFRADICGNLFTHYKREEDATMESGKFDEELLRMSGIVDSLTPHSMLLFNESFASTYEKEGSEIARQIVRALLETPVKIFFVTHLYEFAREICEEKMEGTAFLRAERQPDGQRTFKLIPGEPLQTSFGVDLYNKIFGNATGNQRQDDSGQMRNRGETVLFPLNTEETQQEQQD